VNFDPAYSTLIFTWRTFQCSPHPKPCCQTTSFPSCGWRPTCPNVLCSDVKVCVRSVVNGLSQIRVWRLPSISSTFYERVFCAKFCLQKLQSWNITRESCTIRFCMKKARVKCSWNWHLVDFDNFLREREKMKYYDYGLYISPGVNFINMLMFSFYMHKCFGTNNTTPNFTRTLN